jgi:hypothetical protein
MVVGRREAVSVKPSQEKSSRLPSSYDIFIHHSFRAAGRNLSSRPTAEKSGTVGLAKNCIFKRKAKILFCQMTLKSWFWREKYGQWPETGRWPFYKDDTCIFFWDLSIFFEAEAHQKIYKKKLKETKS